MWCAQTLKLSRPMAIVAKTKARYPNSGLRLKTGRISLTTPIAGRMTMYTSGWPKNQKRCCHRIGLPPDVRVEEAAAVVAVDEERDHAGREDRRGEQDQRRR